MIPALVPEHLQPRGPEEPRQRAVAPAALGAKEDRRAGAGEGVAPQAFADGGVRLGARERGEVEGRSWDHFGTK